RASSKAVGAWDVHTRQGDGRTRAERARSRRFGASGVQGRPISGPGANPIHQTSSTCTPGAPRALLHERDARWQAPRPAVAAGLAVTRGADARTRGPAWQ